MASKRGTCIQHFSIGIFKRWKACIFIVVIFASVPIYQRIKVSTDYLLLFMRRVNVSSATTAFVPTQPCSNSTDYIARKIEHRLNISLENISWKSVEIVNAHVRAGGWYKPLTCVAEENIAVIIPYRDREEHLKIYLRHMHPFLQRQELEYKIFVVEMPAGVKFNRALLMNVGFVEALKEGDFGCFVFHDVDLLPEDDSNLYTCANSPRHMSVAIDKDKYKLPYDTYFGGLCAISKEHFQKMNGFSNLYFGWGGEDDDLHDRVKAIGMKLHRIPSDIGRYKMIPHTHAEESPDKFKLYKTMRRRYKTEGLNSLRYNVTKLEHKPLYTWILVRVNETEVLDSDSIHKEAFS